MEKTKQRNQITAGEFMELADQIKMAVEKKVDNVRNTMEDLEGEGVNTYFNGKAMAKSGASAAFDIVTEIYDVDNGIDAYGDIYDISYERNTSFKFKVYSKRIVFYTPDGFEAEPVEDIGDMFCEQGVWRN
jgi:hypothetical protein